MLAQEKPRGAGGRARGTVGKIDWKPIYVDDSPASLAAQRLAARFRLTPPTARVVAALAGFGEVRT